MLPFIVSILAPLMSCIQMFPQLWKIIHSKNVRDISFYSLVLILFSNFLWLLHCYFIMVVYSILAEIMAILINIFLLGLFFHHRKKSHKYS
jgi:uncharacterized protein with PQ loop repeat